VGGLLDDVRTTWRARDRWAAGVAACAALGAALVGLVWGTWAASGADAYGYVSQALQWKTLQLVVPVPLAAGAPWPSPEWTFAPLGWRPAVDPGAIVPTYAPGLPLAMAAVAWLCGNSAVFWIVPVAGALSVWLTWILGTQLSNRTAAAMAAVLMATGPVFLFQVVQPMSDVPAAAWWTGALVALLAGHPIVGGLCASGAILTRPNLAPLVLWLALVPVLIPTAIPVAFRASWRARLRVTRGFLLAALPGVVAWLAINRWWYGSAFVSGYGSTGDLFSLSHVPDNAARYGGWLLHTYTVFIVVGVVGPVMAWWAGRRERRHGKPRVGDEGTDSSSVRAGRETNPSSSHATKTQSSCGTLVAALVFALLVVTAYLPYTVFDDWTYLRFLLPALPVLLVLGSDVATRVVARLPAAIAALALTAGALLLVAHQVVVARDGQAFGLQRLEHRYVEAGRFAARQFPASAVFLAVQQSGSLRIYAGRPILRWDLIDPRSFDGVIAYLSAAGYTPYLVLEAWEEPQFRDLLSAWSPLGNLDWPPAAELGLSVKIRFYDPRDRTAFLAGRPSHTIRPLRERQRQ
jgi:hypothetical protein